MRKLYIGLFSIMLLSLLISSGSAGDESERPLPITQSVSATGEVTPDPNWELKESSQPAHDEVTVPLVPVGPWSNGVPATEEEIAARLALDPTVSAHRFSSDLKANPTPNTSPSPPMDRTTDLLFEGFEGGAVPPTGWTTTVNNSYTWEIDSYDPYEGNYNASCFYDASLSGTQDEWLISPTIDLTTGGSSWILDFAWLGSYYWSVDPFDNCELEVWISTDGGATFPTMLWSEDGVGAFSDWTWYQVSIPLTGYLGQSNVKIGFRYYGYDGAQFSIDALSINDAQLPTGRCCYGDPFNPGCEDGVTLATCDGLGGNWVQGLDCTTDCPVPGDNDECTNAELIAGPFPTIVNGTTVGATIDCPGVLDWNAVWYKFDVTGSCNNVEVNYCGTSSEILCIGVVLYNDCNDCGAYIIADDVLFESCGPLTQPRLVWENLPGPATYYLPVFIGDGGCAPIESDFEFTIDVQECPPAQQGDFCGEPIVVNIGGAGELPTSLLNQYTCGRDDYYSSTCLGSYDGGEDIIYQLIVSSAVDIDITLDPKGTTWTGFLIDDACPADPSTCIATASSSSSAPYTIGGVHLEAGTYYIMVDTWPSPDCIPDFDLHIEAAAPPTEGDNCASPIQVKLPDDLPYSDLSQYNCGRGNNYNSTCLGFYDGGEDIIYLIDVVSAMNVDIVLDPKGTTYTGIAIDDQCPLSSSCIAKSTSSSSSPHGMYNVHLEPGLYYIMIDTWPSPNCIPDFDLTITTSAGGPENDDWASCEEIGDVTDLPFSTAVASVDGPQGCQYAPNIWYCYTASCDGDVTVSLCGSSYDCKLAVYDGVDPNTAAVLGCNDDACGLQSIVEFSASAGNTYLIEVGGYSSNVGEGVISIECSEPCSITCPEGAIAESEACGDDINGGCNMVTPTFEPIGCGQTICGTAWADNGTRDTDWLEFVLDTLSEVTWTIVAEFPLVSGFIEMTVPGSGDCAHSTGFISPFDTGDDCDTISLTTTLPAGIHWIFVGDQAFDGNPCGSGSNDWVGWLECTPVEPQYCDASGGCDEYIENVTVGTINNSSGCDNYGDFTAISTEMDPGTGYPITVSIGNAYSLDEGAVWVDWNQDKDFDDPGEQVTMSVSTGYGPYTGTITPPGDATPGPTRMRVRLTWNLTPQPCGTTTYGEVEDYTIVVTGGDGTLAIMTDPMPFLVLYKFAVDPMIAHLYISDEYSEGGGYGMADVELSSVTLSVVSSGCPVTLSGVPTLLASLPGMSGQVLDCPFPIADYIICEEDGGLLYDEVESFFDLQCTVDIGGTPTPQTISGKIIIIGHVSGDVDLSGTVDILDIIYLVQYLFQGGPAPVVPELADVDGSGSIDIADLLAIISYLFNDGPQLSHP